MSAALNEAAARLAARAEVNGAEPTVEGAQAKAATFIDASVRQIVGTVIRGLMVSAPGIDPRVLLNAICKETGNLCAGAIAGDLQSVLLIRAGMKKAFEDGVKTAPVNQTPPPAASPRR